MAGLMPLRGEPRHEARVNDVWRAVLDSAVGAFLFLAGAATGIIGGIAMAWFVWVSQTGAPGMILGYAGAACYVGLLYVGCRLGAFGMDGRSGAFLPASGWLLATLLIATVNTGGDIIIADQALNYLLLFGGVIAVAAAVVTAPIGPRRTPAPRR